MAEIKKLGKLRQRIDAIAVDDSTGILGIILDDVEDLDSRVDALEGLRYEYVVVKIAGTGIDGNLQDGDAELGVVPLAGEIAAAYAVTTDASATATITVASATYANYDTFTQAGSFTINNAKKAAATITSWTKTVTAGSILKCSVAPVGETIAGKVLYVIIKIQVV